MTSGRRFGGAGIRRGVRVDGGGVAVDTGVDPTGDAALSLDLEEGVGITGDPVTQWADQSGVGNHFTGTAGTNPDDDGGVVVFDGTNDLIAGPTAAAFVKADGTEFLWYYVVTFTADGPSTTKTAAAAAVTGGFDTGGAGIYYYKSGAQNYVFGQFYSASNIIMTSERPVSTSTLYLLRYRLDGTNIYLRANGGEISDACVLVDGLTADMRIGRGWVISAHCPMRVRRVVKIRAHRSQGTRDDHDAWFQAQYPGITL